MPRTSFLTFGAPRALAPVNPEGAPRASAMPERETRKLKKRRPAPKSIAYDSVKPAKVGAGGTSFKTSLVNAFHTIREVITRPVVTRALHKRISEACAKELFENHSPVWATDVFDLLLAMKPKLCGNRKLQAQVTDREIEICAQAAAYSVSRSMGLAYSPFNLEARASDAEVVARAPVSPDAASQHSALLAPVLPAPELSSRGPTPPLPARNPRRKESASSRVVTAFAAELDARFNGGLRTPSLDFMRAPSPRAVRALSPPEQAPIHRSTPKLVAPKPQRVSVSRVLSVQTQNLAQRGTTHFPRLGEQSPRVSYSPMSPYSNYIETPDAGTPFEVNIW